METAIVSCMHPSNGALTSEDNVRKLNTFKIIKGRIEYTDIVKRAVLDPKISGLNLNCNGGWDWIDQKYGFIKLLLSRGQIAEIHTGQDLLACRDYLEAAQLGCFKSYSVSVHFEIRDICGLKNRRTAYASEKRMQAAQEKFQAFKSEQSAKRGA